jgi:hypothetical protein
VNFFEIDHPATARLKAKGIDAMGRRDNLCLIAEDLGKHKLSDVLKTNELWDQSARSVIIAEGLVMYLPPEAVRDLFYQSAVITIIINSSWRKIMLRCRKFLIGIIYLSIFAFAISSYADEEIEDLIDIAESKGKIIAIIEGRKTITFDLRPNEKVLWSGAKGYLGAFLTDQRFFVISTSLNTWQELPLRLDEPGKAVASLSPYIALLVTRDRAIGFDATFNRFIETQLPIHDQLLAAKVDKYVAVVITSSRAFGLAAESSAFMEINLRIRETVEEIKLTSSKATVRTSDRLLSFEATGSAWNEYRLY